MTTALPTPAPTPVPGDRATLSAGPVTTADLVRYAGASGDFNPIHYDHLHAVASGMDGVIAHGLYVMGVAARVFDGWLGTRGEVAAYDARFAAPVKPGDRLEVAATVQAVEGGQARVAVEGRVGDRKVLAAEAVLRLAPAP